MARSTNGTNPEAYSALQQLGESIWKYLKERGGIDPDDSTLRETVFRLVLEQYHGGTPDTETIKQAVLKLLEVGIL
jgi:hypothetical protein